MLRQAVVRLCRTSKLLRIPLRTVYRSVIENGEKTALIDEHGRYSYSQLLAASIELRDKLQSVTDAQQQSSKKRIAFLCHPGASFIVTQWSCWLSRAICIPLCKDHPQSLLEYYIDDAQCSHLVASPEYDPILRPLAEKFRIPLLHVDHQQIKAEQDKDTLKSRNLQEFDLFSTSSDDALILYTSGTTGKPKVDICTLQFILLMTSIV
jgi:acyl-CoA synthetase (AMP-forming)/AMP-acid ligase II